ncbi:MAG: class I SAM-dependent DNA methyltransferase, partial [Planctomycetota bacterium]|nr:class I SAM-dependent DNA methyltransferase [Planctomycetota bacterium]
FLGGNKLWPVFGGSFRDFIKMLHPNSGGKAVDLVAHFFRMAHLLIRNDGTVGLIATNTICQGSTRTAGLGEILAQGGEIYWVNRRLSWPGHAAVVVSVVCFKNGQVKSKRYLDGKEVDGINSLFFPRKLELNPQPLNLNKSVSFLGTNILGQGFTFNDSAPKGGSANSIDKMEKLLVSNPKNRERIQPYIGGEEVNQSPGLTPHRFVINFADLPLIQAKEWPELVDVVETMVKPARDKLGGYSVAEGRRTRWWQFGTYTPALYNAIKGLKQVLVTARVGNHLSLAFLPTNYVYSEQLVIFPFGTFASFSTLQSRPHEAWARLLGSSMKDDLRYSASKILNPFPFPFNWSKDPQLEVIGQEYYDFRAALMIENNEGLTATYNRFHNPEERDPEILKLRELHSVMDRAVLDAYGWTDISTDCEFLLDYEIDEETWGKKKKPYRYRWPEDVHDEVLARLLDLNQKRYEEEVLAGLHDDKKGKKKAKKKPAKGKAKKTKKAATKKTKASEKAGDTMLLFGDKEE